MTYERWYAFWNTVLEAIRAFWAVLPKEAKVCCYLFGAVVLDNWARTIQPEALEMIPVTYRVLAFNLLEVFLIETAKRVKAKAEAK